ncbi:MAG: pyrroline-5-carboxylate reductase [Prevotella sp.]|nr:pyrroline-5-carboxylate reductase [Prevotella sp.]
MKIAVIGGGNMGGALAKGWGKTLGTEWHIVVTARTEETLRRLKAACPRLETTTSNLDAASDADVIVLCVKPWLIDAVVYGLRSVLKGKTVISVAANARNEAIDIYSMPNIAAEYGASMTFIEENSNKKATNVACSLFGSIGLAKVVTAKQMSAGLMMSGCGIAYVMRFLRAMTEGGVELGFQADVAKEVAMQTMAGAVKLLQETGLHPEQAIDRVTTPGGITIKGLNELERAGFTSSVIRGLKAGL